MSVFDHLMRDTIYVRHLTGATANGAKVYDPPRESPPARIRGRLAFERRLIATTDGRQVASEAVLYALEPLGVGDLVIHEGREWPALQVGEKRGLFGGTDHWEVRL